MDEKVKQWREDGKHYHPIMKDFHDAKDLFKLIHTVTDVENHKYCKDITWVKGQCYVVDIFLWCMARYGYTLQKTRTKLNFEDIHADLERLRENRATSFAEIINSATDRAYKGFENVNKRTSDKRIDIQNRKALERG